jgi:hypothetical protein
MTMRIRLALAIAVGSVLCVAIAPAEEIYLLANFDDKTIDAPVGVRGAELGEPVSVAPYVLATVRGTPTPTPCLQITDNDDWMAGSARFEFLGGAEVTTGRVVIRMQLWFPDMEGRHFTLSVREHDGAAQTFTDLYFGAAGSVACRDKSGYVGIIGTYPTDQLVPVRIAFDMEAGTYDVSVNGTPMLLGRAHGVTAAGIGSVLVGNDNDVSVGNCFYIDNLYVADGDPTPAEPISWGAAKAQFLGAE